MPDSEKDGIDSDDELSDARRLLALAEIVDRYPKVVTRRVNGIIYILIGGGISFATLVMFVLTVVYSPLAWNPLLNLAFVAVSLLITWVIAFRLFGPLTRSFPKREVQQKPPTWFYIMWGVIGVILAVASVFLFTQENQLGFPILVQCVLAFGQSVNYYFSRKDPESGGFYKENLVFAIAALLSIPLMLLLQELAYLILIIVDIGGIYIIGVYALITAERLLLETTGRG
ncbi:MAG: hypothetical protein ACFFFC_17145 [Candidatus Thorarchaeota archaeon]